MQDNSRALIWDIETTSLSPRRGRMLSCTFVWLDQDKPFSVVSILPESEMNALLAVKWRLESVDAIIGFSSIRFDLNFINKRLGMYGYDDIYQPNHIDVQKMYTGGKDIRISLERVAEALGISDEQAHKTVYDSRIWKAADEGHEESLQWIVSHAESDVILTKRAYLKMIGEEWETQTIASGVATEAHGLAAATAEK